MSTNIDAMVEQAMDAMDAYWNDPALSAPCPSCKGTGMVPLGDSQDWCDCGTGYVHLGTEAGAMRAALIACGVAT